MRVTALLFATVLLLSACGDDGAPPADAPGETGAPDDAAGGTQPHDDELASITGAFGGDAQLEGGCAWVETDGQRYEVQWPEGYTVDFAASPITLKGPDGAVVAEAGDTITVAGSVNSEAMSICQIGPIFAGTAVTTG